MVHPDQDHGLNLASGSQAVGGGVGAPGVARDIGSPPIEDVLAVVQVQHREPPGRVTLVSFGKIDCDVARAGQKTGAETVQHQKARIRIEFAGRRCSARQRLEWV